MGPRQFFLVNPHGILFGAGSQVNAPGLVASAMDMSPSDFLAGRYRFQAGQEGGYILNQGNITAERGGYLAMLGRSVRNEGLIQAPEGSVALGAEIQQRFPLIPPVWFQSRSTPPFNPMFLIWRVKKSTTRSPIQGLFPLMGAM